MYDYFIMGDSFLSGVFYPGEGGGGFCPVPNLYNIGVHVLNRSLGDAF